MVRSISGAEALVNSYLTKAEIFIGRKGNVGSVFWSFKDYWPIDTVYFINSEQSDFYLFYALKNMQFMSTDVAVPGLNRNFAYSRSLIKPSKRISKQFINEIRFIRDQIENLDKYNTKLSQARDLLLPKLMSGEIEV